MKKSQSVKFLNFVFFILLVPLLAFTGEVFEITIKISPNVLNLGSSGTVVTVHTDLPYSLVQGSTLYLDGVAINSWKADDRGNFVAKFVMSEIKSLPLQINHYHTFELRGLTVTGDEFWGTQDILIINKKGGQAERRHRSYL